MPSKRDFEAAETLPSDDAVGRCCPLTPHPSPAGIATSCSTCSAKAAWAWSTRCAIAASAAPIGIRGGGADMAAARRGRCPSGALGAGAQPAASQGTDRAHRTPAAARAVAYAPALPARRRRGPMPASRPRRRRDRPRLRAASRRILTYQPHVGYVAVRLQLQVPPQAPHPDGPADCHHDTTDQTTYRHFLLRECAATDSKPWAVHRRTSAQADSNLGA